jgi:hypothetical protein
MKNEEWKNKKEEWRKMKREREDQKMPVRSTFFQFVSIWQPSEIVMTGQPWWISCVDISTIPAAALFLSFWRRRTDVISQHTLCGIDPFILLSHYEVLVQSSFPICNYYKDLILYLTPLLHLQSPYFECTFC